MVHVLRLTNSDDVNPLIPERDRMTAVASRTFERLTGEPADTTVKIIWPTSRLPDLVDRWLDELQPEMVFLRVSGFWVTYESVPLRIRRLLGPAGTPVASLGWRAAATPWIGSRRLFHLTRGFLLRTIGGDTHFTVDEVAGVIESCIRRTIEREEPVLAVRAPHASYAAPACRGRAVARCNALRARLADVCAALHVPYLGSDPADGLPPEHKGFLPDRLHVSEDLHRLRGEAEGDFMAAAWLRSQGKELRPGSARSG